MNRGVVSTMRNWRGRKGQTIVIVALSAVTLFALVGVAVDGGGAMLQRRNMQNGADAGALAALSVLSSRVSITCPTPYNDIQHWRCNLRK